MRRVLRVSLTVLQSHKEIPRNLWSLIVHQLVYKLPPFDLLSFLEDHIYCKPPICVCHLQWLIS
jgi:hypothetical protein